MHVESERREKRRPASEVLKQNILYTYLYCHKAAESALVPVPANKLSPRRSATSSVASVSCGMK